MPDYTNTRNVTVEGRSYVINESKNSDAGIPFDLELQPAKTGTLTTRTDNDTGTLTLDTGHGVANGNRLDVYWDGGRRRGMTVGVVAGNSVPIDLGAGDNLPALNTAVTVMVPIVQEIAFTGDNAVMVGVSCPVKGTFAFAEAGADSANGFFLTSPTEPNKVWEEDDSGTNPFAGDDITKVYLSHDDAVNAVLLSGIVLYN